MNRLNPEPLTPLISIVVPVYNEARTVAEVIERLIAIDLPAPREILVVNDGSTDGTREVLDRIAAASRAAHHPRREERRQGQRDPHRLRARAPAPSSRSRMRTSNSIRRRSPSWCSRFSTAARSVVYGSRFLAGRPAAPWLSIVANQVLTGVTNLLFGGRLTDMETCYKVMTRDVAQSLDLESNRFDIEPEITAKLLRAGHRSSSCRFASSRAAAPRARRSAGATACSAIQVLFKYRFSK